ncbi:MAG TPA: DUF3194 domain-containing protein [Thermoprotei archaeon]|nr:MAG: hypothetical protein DRJ63_00500 [Thermoprotei archaeon]HDI75252.1 DUF3194 domain-containing protein [Thermoprotei archaeon]
MKLSEEFREKLLNKVADTVYRFIYSKVKHPEDILDIIIEVDFSEDSEFTIDVYVDVNPFSKIDPKELAEAAAEEGLKVAEHELLKYKKSEVATRQ